MNTPPLLLLYLLNFAYVGLLPRIFFRKGGTLNSRWWATATPFILCMLLFIHALLKLDLLPGFITHPLLPQSFQHVYELLTVPLSVLSITLISLTIGTHRVPLALWHQQNDAPAHLVTWGPYSRIRHPFYTAFILALLGAFIFYACLLTLITLLYGATILNLTAAGEERKLSASEFGEEYQAYMKRTGRFFPWIQSLPLKGDA